MLDNATIPVVGFVAPSGTGKTQLLKALIRDLKSTGYKIAVIKHSHHDFEIDKPGKDSYELRMSGASQMLIASKYRRALVVEYDDTEQEVNLNELIKHLDQSALDIILVEGFKFESFPKVEVYRSDTDSTREHRKPLFLSDPDIIAIATDMSFVIQDGIVALDMNNIKQISEFIIQRFSLQSAI